MEKEKKQGSFKKAFYRLCYSEDNNFSITRITMVVTFASSLLLLWAGAILSVYGVKIYSEVYTYSIALSGGSILQYGGTKIKSVLAKNK